MLDIPHTVVHDPHRPKSEAILNMSKKPKAAPLPEYRQPVILSPLTGELLLSLRGNELQATDCRDHSVLIPLTLDGLRLLKLMLQSRINPANHNIGTIAEPTQRMVEEFLKGNELKEMERMENKLNELKEMF